jgi:RimJ/RimL family protein N-acetyltransferase
MIGKWRGWQVTGICPLGRGIGLRGEREQKLLDCLGITITRIPCSIGNDYLALRSYRFKDLPVLYTLFTPEVILKACGITHRPFHSFFSFYKWMVTTFPIVYVVQVRESGRRRIVGFAGLYNLDIGCNLQVSLAIFHPDDRQRGYGQQALTLLLQALQSNRVVKTVGVEVLKVNVASLRFCQKLGFAVRGQNEESFVLEKSVAVSEIG